MKSAVNAAGCKRHGGAGRGAHFRQRGGQEQQNHHQQGNQFPHGFLQGGAFGERGYLVATMKGYTICAMGASTHFLLARHFLVTGGEDSLRGQKKSTDSIEPMLILRENILTHQTVSKCRTSEWMILENALVALPAM